MMQCCWWCYAPSSCSQQQEVVPTRVRAALKTSLPWFFKQSRRFDREIRCKKKSHFLVLETISVRATFSGASALTGSWSLSDRCCNLRHDGRGQCSGSSACTASSCQSRRRLGCAARAPGRRCRRQDNSNRHTESSQRWHKARVSFTHLY